VRLATSLAPIASDAATRWQRRHCLLMLLLLLLLLLMLLLTWWQLLLSLVSCYLQCLIVCLQLGVTTSQQLLCLRTRSIAPHCILLGFRSASVATATRLTPIGVSRAVPRVYLLQSASPLPCQLLLPRIHLLLTLSSFPNARHPPLMKGMPPFKQC